MNLMNILIPTAGRNRPVLRTLRVASERPNGNRNPMRTTALDTGRLTGESAGIRAT